MTRHQHQAPVIKLLYAALFVVFSFGSFGQAVLPDHQPARETAKDACADEACESGTDGALSQNDAGSLADIPSAIINPAPKVKQLRVSLNPFSKFIAIQPGQPLLNKAVLLVVSIASKEAEHTGDSSIKIIPLPRNDLPPALA